MRLIDADKYRDSLEKSWKNCQEWQDGADTEEIRIRAEQAEITFIECILRLKEQPTVDAVPVEHVKKMIESVKSLPDDNYFLKYFAVNVMDALILGWRAEQEEKNETDKCG